MPTPFERREARISASIDREHGERTRITPRAAGTYMAGTTDPGRPVLENIIGIVDLKPVVARIKDRAEYDAFRSEVEGEVIHVTYATSRFASQASWPKAKDEIEAIDRATMPNRFQVVAVMPDGLGRILCMCVVAK